MSKLKIKGVIAASLGVVLFATAACGDDTDDSAGGASGASDAVTALKACVGSGTDVDKLVTDAKAEGTLTFFSTAVEPQIQQAAAAFKEQFGIDIEALRVTSSDQAQRLPAEAEAGSVSTDVVTNTDTVLMTEFLDKGVTQPLAGQVASLEGYPTQWKTDKWAVVSIAPIGIVYNTESTPENLVPTDWKDLLKPEVKGQVAITPIGNSASYQALFNSLYTNPALGAGFMTGLKGQELYPTAGGPEMVQAVAAGETMMGLPANEGSISDLVKDGAPLKLVVPADTGGVEQLLALVADKHLKHPNAARLFANWFLCEGGQTAWNANFTTSPLNASYGKAPLPANYKTLDVTAGAAAWSTIQPLVGLK